MTKVESVRCLALTLCCITVVLTQKSNDLVKLKVGYRVINTFKFLFTSLSLLNSVRIILLLQCVNDSKTLRDDVLHFISEHPLLDSSVPCVHSAPIYFAKDVIFTNIVVDIVDAKDGSYLVYFLGTGEIY